MREEEINKWGMGIIVNICNEQILTRNEQLRSWCKSLQIKYNNRNLESYYKKIRKNGDLQYIHL